MKYRLYIDEVGNSDLKASQNPNHRYLNLTGILIDLDHVRDVIFPETEQLKQAFFNSHPDEPIILHRRELVRRLKPFQALNNPELRAKFDEALLDRLTNWNYHVISVTIDKLEHQNQYEVWRYHPYHYCLHILLERYVMFLENEQCVGDVMAESRGGREDRKLKESFTRTYDNGTSYVVKERFQDVLTSKQLKLKNKKSNIAGLQLADLLAHPCNKSIIASRNNQKQPEDFGGKIIDILSKSKYLRNPRNGKIEGWGKKWLS